jgi:type VI secretion system protein ImpC
MNRTEQSVEAAQAVTKEADEFTALLSKKFRPKTERAKSEIENAVNALAQHALQDSTVVGDDVIETINAIIAALDEKLTAQVNAVMHHEDFLKLEGTWRGLHHLVSRTETDSQLKIRVLNISRNEISRTTKRYRGTNWDQSPLFKKIYETEFGVAGGEPFGCLVGDYEFDHSPQDVATLQDIAKISAAAHVPFLAATKSSLLGLDSWQELQNPTDIKKLFTTPEYAAWRSLRESEDSKYLGLTMPRFLTRHPYGASTDPVEEFAFEEDTSDPTGQSFVWGNAAFAMAANITQSFKEYGWCSRIVGFQSGGAVEDLPVHTFPTDDGGVDMKCPTEIAITDRREKELADSGLIALCHKKNTNVAAFMAAPSVHLPPQFDDATATANARLGANLSYLFATCRFAHYLKCMVRDQIGSGRSREQLELWLHNWIMNYVDGSPMNSSDEEKARKPLADASVVVEEDPENPGFYQSKFYLKPHYLLSGLTVSLRLVSKLPASKQA